MSNVDLSGRFKEKPVLWTDEEMKIVLAYYYFIYQTNTRKYDYELFADHLRKMTGNKRSNGSVSVRFGNFISIDPSRTSKGFANANKKCISIWNEYINEDGTPRENFIILFWSFIEKFGENNKIYEPFTKKYASFRSTNAEKKELEDAFFEKYDIEVASKIKTKKINRDHLFNESFETMNYTNVIKRKRSSDVAAYTRNRAQGICDLCGSNAPFIDKNGLPFLESHHLITLSEGGPDAIFNTVALCPNCHRKMHMIGDIEDKNFLKMVIYKYLLTEEEKDIIEKFEKLFDARDELLNKRH